MLKNKTKLKISIALGIMLLVMLLLGTTKVNATEISDEKFQQVVNIIPSNIELGIPENEYEKAGTIIRVKVMKLLRENNIKFSVIDNTLKLEDDFNGVSINVVTPNIYSKGINTSTIMINQTKKNINLTYNNHNKYNSSDESYVKNLKIESPKYYISNSGDSLMYHVKLAQEFYKRASEKEEKTLQLTQQLINSIDENKKAEIQQQIDSLDIEYGDYSKSYFMKVIEEYYTNLVNDKSITIKAEVKAGGTEGINEWTYEGGTYLAIFRNGVLYDTRIMGTEVLVPSLDIPDNIKESEIEQFVIDIIKKTNAEFGNNITRIEKGTKEKLGKDIPNGYTIYAEGYENSIIILNIGATNYTVTVVDDNTNIKLETDTDVVPANTVLITQLVKETGVLNVIKLSLKDISTKYIPYDITLKSGGVTIQPNGNVKISIPIPADYDKTKLTVYRIEENGTKTKYNVTVEEGFATFETDHFSTYVLAENNITTDNINNENNITTDSTTKEKDNTPKTGKLDIINYVLVVTAIAGIVILTFKKYSK